MNIQEGLFRISYVFWSFIGLVAFGLGCILMYENPSPLSAAFLLGAIFVPIIANKVTCWVFAGFFAPRS